MASKKSKETSGVKTTITVRGQSFELTDDQLAEAAKRVEASGLITKHSPAGGADPITGESVMESPSYTALPLGSRFTKIKSNGAGVVLHLEEVMDENNSRDVVFKSADAPHTDFTDAMRAVEKLAREILALPETYARHSLHVGGVSISYSKDDTKGVVISGWINLDTANSPFFFNTPHLPYAAASEGSTVPVVSKAGIIALNWLEHEAAAYLGGKRAQLDMFDERDAA